MRRKERLSFKSQVNYFDPIKMSNIFFTEFNDSLETEDLINKIIEKFFQEQKIKDKKMKEEIKNVFADILLIYFDTSEKKRNKRPFIYRYINHYFPNLNPVEKEKYYRQIKRLLLKFKKYCENGRLKVWMNLEF